MKHENERVWLISEQILYLHGMLPPANEFYLKETRKINQYWLHIRWLVCSKCERVLWYMIKLMSLHSIEDEGEKFIITVIRSIGAEMISGQNHFLYHWYGLAYVNFTFLLLFCRLWIKTLLYTCLWLIQGMNISQSHMNSCLYFSSNGTEILVGWRIAKIQRVEEKAHNYEQKYQLSHLKYVYQKPT